MRNQGQGLVMFIEDLYVVFLYESQRSGECLQDPWSSGLQMQKRMVLISCLDSVISLVIN